MLTGSPKRKLMVWLQFAMAAPSAFLGILAISSIAEPWHIYILANALNYGFVLASLALMDGSTRDPAPVTNRSRGQIRDAVRYLRSRPDLVLLLTCVFFLGVFDMNFQVTSALTATQTFGKGAGEFEILGSIMAIGSLAGALHAAGRTRPRLRFVVGAGLLQMTSAPSMHGRVVSLYLMVFIGSAPWALTRQTWSAADPERRGPPLPAAHRPAAAALPFLQ